MAISRSVSKSLTSSTLLRPASRERMRHLKNGCFGIQRITLHAVIAGECSRAGMIPASDVAISRSVSKSLTSSTLLRPASRERMRVLKNGCFGIQRITLHAVIAGECSRAGIIPASDRGNLPFSVEKPKFRQIASAGIQRTNAASRERMLRHLKNRCFGI